MMAAMTAMGQQTVSVADARAKATAFLNRNAGAKGGTVTTDVQLAYTAQQGAETYYYVFNNGSDGKGGFVIIGGDETARTILGYSDNGTFDPNNMPENMKWWLSQYEQQRRHKKRRHHSSSQRRHGRREEYCKSEYNTTLRHNMGSGKTIQRSDNRQHRIYTRHGLRSNSYGTDNEET